MHHRLGVTICILAFTSAAQAANYVVAPSGRDNNPGSASAPFRTVQKGLSSLRPGDKLTIRPGTYAESTTLFTSGRADAPIVVEAEPGAVFTSPDPTGHAEAINVAGGVAYVRLAGIEATGGYGESILIRSGTHHIEVSNCRLHGNRVGVAIVGGEAISVRGCALFENRRAGLRITGTAHDVTVQDTDAFENSDGLGCDGEGDGFVIDSDAVRNVVFQGARAFRNSEDGFDLHGAGLILDQVQSLDQCGGMKLRDSASVSNCVVADNRSGVKTTALQRTTHFSIEHCTFADNIFPIVLDAPNSPVRQYGVDLFNNIVIAPNWALEYDESVQLREGHNIFWRGDQQQTLIKVLPGGGGYSGADINNGRWRQYTGQGEATLSLDPALRNPAASDFVPLADSAAIDRADSRHTAPTDIVDTPRPQGRAADLGAFEVTSPASNHRPQADAGAPARSLVVNRSATFDGSASFDPDGNPITYLWSFGDGGTAASARVFHTYSRAGQYSATLTVSDGNAASVARVLVTVVDSLRPPRPTRTRPGGPRATPTPAPPGTPTAVPTSAAPSQAQLAVSASSSGRPGALIDISARYRNLPGSATIKVVLPAELRAETVVPGGATNGGTQVVWPAVSGTTGALKIKARVAANARSGSRVSIVVTIIENASGRSVSQQATTVIQ